MGTAKESPDRARILIVEDEALLSWSLTHFLRERGYSVTTVDAGDTALAELASAAFDLVITDLKLPHLDGLSLISQIKRRSPDLPIILISALPDEAMVARLGESQADRFVEKPFNLSEMLELVELLLKKGAHRWFRPAAL